MEKKKYYYYYYHKIVQMKIIETNQELKKNNRIKLTANIFKNIFFIRCCFKCLKYK